MYKNYQNSETFTALDANSVMRQGLIPIASLSARNQLVTHEGMTIYRQDLDREERFDGTNWVANEPGSLLLYPSSVVNATVSADGSIIPASGATSISVNDVFSTKYRRFRIVAYVKCTGNSAPTFRFRSAGADHTGGNYNNQINGIANGSGGAGKENSATLVNLAPISAAYHEFTIELTNPMTSGVVKTGSARCLSFVNGSGSRLGEFWLGNNDNALFDGFTIAFQGTVDSAAKSYFKITAYA